MTNTHGKSFNASQVLAVPATSTAVAVPAFRGRGLRDKRTADNLRRVALDLHASLIHRGEMALTEIGRLMPPGFRTAKPSTLHIQDFIKLYPSPHVLYTVGTKCA